MQWNLTQLLFLQFTFERLWLACCTLNYEDMESVTHPFRRVEVWLHRVSSMWGLLLRCINEAERTSNIKITAEINQNVNLKRIMMRQICGNQIVGLTFGRKALDRYRPPPVTTYARRLLPASGAPMTWGSHETWAVWSMLYVLSLVACWCTIEHKTLTAKQAKTLQLQPKETKLEQEHSTRGWVMVPPLLPASQLAWDLWDPIHFFLLLPGSLLCPTSPAQMRSWVLVRSIKCAAA